MKLDWTRKNKKSTKIGLKTDHDSQKSSTIVLAYPILLEILLLHLITCEWKPAIKLLSIALNL